VTVKLRELISRGVIRKIPSTDATDSLDRLPKIWSERVIFALDVHSGQSPLHTRFGHFLDAFCFTVREFETFHSRLSTHRTEVHAYDVLLSQLTNVAKNLETYFKSAKRTAPNEVLFQGRLVAGAVVNIYVRSGDNDADGNMLC
jgi:predicted dehydrogenase